MLALQVTILGKVLWFSNKLEWRELKLNSIRSTNVALGLLDPDDKLFSFHKWCRISWKWAFALLSIIIFIV